MKEKHKKNSHYLEVFLDKKWVSLIDELCLVHGKSHRAVSWISSYTQKKRLHILLEITQGKGESILDVGCGQGALYDLIQEKELDLCYEGIDFSPNMVALARNTFPEGSFVLLDFMEDPLPARYDYILASGPFNYRISRPKKMIQYAISKMWKHAKKGVAFNLLSKYMPDIYESTSLIQAFDPVFIVQYCLTLTPYVQLRHDYLDNDFTIYMRRELL